MTHFCIKPYSGYNKLYGWFSTQAVHFSAPGFYRHLKLVRWGDYLFTLAREAGYGHIRPQLQAGGDLLAAIQQQEELTIRQVQAAQAQMGGRGN